MDWRCSACLRQRQHAVGLQCRRHGRSFDRLHQRHRLVRFGKHGVLDAREVDSAVADLADAPIHRCDHRPLLVRARRFAAALSGYDALYAAAAAAYGASLLTGDPVPAGGGAPGDQGAGAARPGDGRSRPGARPGPPASDDGKLDVITASGLNRANVVTELSRIHTGGHVRNPKVAIAQGTIVNIETFLVQDAMPLEADGNVQGVTPVQFQVMPAALRFMLPASESLPGDGGVVPHR